MEVWRKEINSEKAFTLFCFVLFELTFKVIEAFFYDHSIFKNLEMIQSLETI